MLHTVIFCAGLALGAIVGGLIMAALACGAAEDLERERLARRCADRDAAGCAHNECNYQRRVA